MDKNLLDLLRVESRATNDLLSLLVVIQVECMGESKEQIDAISAYRSIRKILEKDREIFARRLANGVVE